ncbi:MAG: M48 family metallopeptidase [Elusimicrobia bacterium]|nr:M48 family metallopeptidase [Elusimicrobiota bacterium]
MLNFTRDFYLSLVIGLLAVDYFLNLLTEYLNLKNLKTELPSEFRDFHNQDSYALSQKYLRENTVFGLITSSVYLAAYIFFILLGGFNFADALARNFGFSGVLTGVIFGLILKIFSDLLDVPFDAYDTFVIEKKYGFNRTTPKTFLLDMAKEWGLTLIIGAPLFAAVLYIFEQAGAAAWFYVWLFITAAEIIIVFVSPVLIMPLFNKFRPLDDSELKAAIESYLDSNNFKIKGVFVMDGSRRSSKSNAFFTGFGKFRRIALLDTLLAKHTRHEILAILGHEIGHYKKKHQFAFFIMSACQTGIMLYILSFFINNGPLFAAFKMERLSVYASLVFFGFLYSPINMLLGMLTNYLARKFEFEADFYSVSTLKKPEDMIKALKKLAVDNLGNLTPHPLKVFLEYTHPPALERIKTIKKYSCL